MPTVPRRNTGPIRQQGYSNARLNTQAPIEAFGGGQGQVTANVGKVLSQVGSIAEEFKLRADDSAVTDALNKSKAAAQQLKFDPKEGWIHRKGKDAIGAVGDYSERYKKSLDDIE